MLNFSRPTAHASPNDLVWAFHGRNLVSELMGSQGAPIPLASLQADFDEVSDLTSVGYLDEKPVYACKVRDKRTGRHEVHKWKPFCASWPL